MRVEVEHLGESLSVESDSPITINEVLQKLSIPSSTVLAVHEKAIVPHTSLIKANICLELVVVSSGG